MNKVNLKFHRFVQPMIFSNISVCVFNPVTTKLTSMLTQNKEKHNYGLTEKEKLIIFITKCVHLDHKTPENYF